MSTLIASTIKFHLPAKIKAYALEKVIVRVKGIFTSSAFKLIQLILPLYNLLDNLTNLSLEVFSNVQFSTLLLFWQ